MDQLVRLTHVRTCPSVSIFVCSPDTEMTNVLALMKSPMTLCIMSIQVKNLLLKYYVTVMTTGGTAQKNFTNLETKMLGFNIPDYPKVILRQVYTLQVSYWFYRPTITIVGPINI